MSCTENESGPFVVFFLPAVVGCLTILLAKRWANSQVVSGSSTAVSRRRKIIKDPLIKRPLPPIALKMLPPGSKKANGVTKKGCIGGDEELMQKRVSQPARVSPSSSPSGASDMKYNEGPVAPKHIPFPVIPHDGELLFEFMTLVFTLLAAALQFLNLYRTVWWLPHSHTNQAMNFYLIDIHLVSFIVAILSRRFLLSLTMAILRSFLNPKFLPHATVASRMFILGVILGVLAWCTYFIALKYPLMKLFYLCYPAIIYFLLFGFRATPFLALDTGGARSLHSCSSDQRQVRAEVEMFRQDFNYRLNMILFNSVCGAYYTSFVPCCFAQSYLYYSVSLTSQQTGFVWGALFCRLGAALLPARYCDVAHRAALHQAPSSDSPSPSSWCGARLWAPDPSHDRFYAVFKNPSTLLCVFLCLQLALIFVQLCLLFSNIPWHGYLAIFLLLFMNYYTMFKLVRDYIVAWKVYKAESMIQEKNINAPVT
ncbi:transmembrane protein 39A [Plutella xylostella]|uniref:transmembrane protein 39A n=1 Tax=Plutella xylostella TaxID=51655 RepID=UPI002032D457|nr:transmembrane protein 39A [Plutella xylostella]